MMHFPTVRDNCLEATPTCPGLNSPTLTVDAKPQRLCGDMVTLLFFLHIRTGSNFSQHVAQREMSPNPSHLVSFQIPLVYQAKLKSFQTTLLCPRASKVWAPAWIGRGFPSAPQADMSDVTLCPINPAAMEKATATTFRFE